MEKQIALLLEPFGVTAFGVCRFEDCLPLLPCRAAGRLPENARSVIVCLFPYDIGDFPVRNIARYAVINDYHTVAGGILCALAESLAAAFPAHCFVPFVDNSPLREVSAAVRAGLGVAGRNGQLIHPVYGSRAFIGEVVSTLEIPPAAPTKKTCLDCGRCLDACPTGALAAGFDRSLCRSHITQKKGALTAWEQQQIRDGGLAWGCDLCVDACPMNTGARSPITAFYENPVPLLTLENLDECMRTKPYGYRGRATLERNLLFLLEKRKSKQKENHI